MDDTHDPDIQKGCRVRRPRLRNRALHGAAEMVLQPYKLTPFLLVARIHFPTGAPDWVPQTNDSLSESKDTSKQTFC